MLPPAVRALVRTVPSVAHVPHRAVLSVTGSQAAEFLNGILSSSIPAHPHSHFYSAFLHAQASARLVLYDTFVYSQLTASGKQGYLIEYDPRPSEAPPLLPTLKKYVLRSKVKIRDVSEEYDVWAAWGSESTKVWETQRRWLHASSGAIEPVWDSQDDWPWGSQPGLLRDRRAIGMGHRLLVKKGDRPQETSTHDTVSAEDYLLHRIAHGVPEGSTEIVPMHAFPMESNLDVMGALDFRKGCFVGQELTVRTYHTGIIRKRILPVLIEPFSGSPTPTAELPSFPSDLDIRAQRTEVDDGPPRPRPRGTGKLLSSTKSVGLALLRLEHVAAVENGSAVFEIEVGEEKKTKWKVTSWWPDWWPHMPESQH
ncbi:Aminomethyltransferase folate-binding domain-containing protein [Rhodofomes roseus]|uniref:Aminomethyltransferase folate-binding domain-containing protein n=1 Tax=Rhodofomes roseus TaxID=34475 RepID=A0ABQ8KXH7_9APHY|nr:Aminomethyltransferase folate-binding domain-containing protein [Rhodofomes roseus]KAH9844007.1 Aminomethyltransferase folate-binding domain-containing protein [Rhodofomes roseus]